MKKLLFICFIIIGGIACGYNISSIASTLPKIKSQLLLSNSTISLIAGLVFAGTAIAKISISILNDTFGRRKTLILAGIIFSGGTISIIFATSVDYIIIGRLLQGIGGGLLMFTISLYIVEMANNQNRGKLTALYQLSFTIGLLLANLIGMLIFDINWKISFIILLIITIFFIFITYYLPCSPRWLLYKGKHELAYEALLINHKKDKIPEIIASWNNTNSNYQNISILQRKYLKVLLLVILITLLNQLTGINAILQTSTTLINYAGQQKALLGSVGITAINVIGTLIGINIVERFPRNLIFGYCGIIISLAHLLIAINFLSGYNSPLILISSLMLFIIAFAIGPGIIIWLIFSEYLPLPVRSQGISIAGFINAVAGFFISSLFMTLNTNYQIGYMFAICSICSLIYGLIPILYLPNTNGKDIEKFDELFKK